jgi:hypothetical protein
VKDLDDPEFAPFLIKVEWLKRQIGEYHNRNNAAMQIPCGVHVLRVIAARGKGWDHVSVSLPTRTPTWDEMEYVRKKLFKPDEIVAQFHVPAEVHINVHPYTLHMWREIGRPFRLPPKKFV